MTETKPFILHISKYYLPVYGGLERVIEGISKYTKNEFAHIICCYNDDHKGNKGRLPKKEIIDSVEIRRMKYWKSGWFHFGIPDVSVLKKASVIHIHNSDLLLDVTILLKIIFKIKAPIIVSTHGLIFHHQNFMSLKVLYLKLTFPVKKKFVSLFLASGINDYSYLKNQLKIEKVILFENPINIPSKFNFPEKREGIISINRLQNSKNIGKTIDICWRIREAGFTEPIRFIISGQEADISELIGTTDFEHYKFELIHNCSDEEKWNYFSSSKYFIHSADYEGFGISVLESLVSGCLTFVTNQVEGNFRHHHFENLFAFSSKDSSEEVSRFILSKNNLNPIQYSRKLLDNFDWEHQCNKISLIYNQVLKNED